MTRPKKTVVIGAEGYTMSTDELRVDCFVWKDIKRIKSLYDYDWVLINLLSISNDKLRENLSWHEVNSVLNIRTASEVLRHGGMIVIVGDPRFSIPDNKESSNSRKPFLDWTGMLFEWDNSSGDTVDFSEYHFGYYKDYIDKLKKWNYSLSRVSVNSQTSGEILKLFESSRKNLSVKASTRYICKNRFSNGLVFEVHLYVTEEERTSYYSRRGSSSPVVSSLGSIIFLPPIEASEDETLKIALYRTLGIEISLPNPDWISSYKVPDEDDIIERINNTNSEIQILNAQIEASKEELKNTKKHLKLLFSRDFELELTVRDVLKELRANVEEPREKNKEDGWVTIKIKDKVYEGVLEIKSTRTTHFGENGIRQLLDWIQRGISIRKKKYKGIFIGNSLVDKPPKERPSPFSDSWATSAKLNQICALTSTDLYIVYTLYLIGKLDTDAFWQEVFESNGILDSQKYWDELSDSESYLP